MAKSDKWIWLGLGGAALAYLATRKDPPSSLSRMNGLGANYSPLPVRIADGASIPDGLRNGTPGRYSIQLRVVDVPISAPLTPYLDVKPFQTALAQAGIVGRVESVKYLRNGEGSSSNWAADTLDDLFSSGGAGSKRFISDRYFDVVIELGGNPQSGTGMGAVQIGAGAVVAIVGAIALAIVAFFPTAREAVIEGAKALAKGLIYEPLAEAGKGVLVLGLAAVAVIFLAKKSGASVKTSKFSF